MRDYLKKNIDVNKKAFLVLKKPFPHVAMFTEILGNATKWLHVW